MVVICEECGKKYRFDYTLMKSDKAKFSCKSCNHLISIKKPEEEGRREKADDFSDEPREEIKITEQSVQTAISSQKRGFTLLPKMLCLFLLIPSIFLLLAGMLYYNQLQDLSTRLVDDSRDVVTGLSEEIIANISRSVGKQCKLYLDSHPKMTKEEFNTNVEFKNLASAKVGKTGYTAFVERPNVVDGKWMIWVHPNSKVVNTDMSSLKDKNPRFWKIQVGVFDGSESRGYYPWEDKDGTSREKFMVFSPIEGTNFAVAATTYIDEFTEPVRAMEQRSHKITVGIRNMVFAILVITLFMIALIVSIYSHKLSQRIRSLTDHAERISVGELDAAIEIKAKDEIGDLAEAITRMQDSIRFSIERLRRRR
ncbi:MAG: HAMP domain-containing protein [Pseudomonadota bacterium]